MKKLFSSKKREDGTPSPSSSSKTLKLVESINLDTRKILNPEHIAIGPMLGQGGFAKVYRCELDGQVAVVKMIDAGKLNEEMTYLLTNECTIWARLAHPNIVAFYGLATNAASIFLACEYFPNGALQDLLEKKRKARAAAPNVLELVQQLQQIAGGMEYLHGLDPPVLHRDLKSANVLIADDSRLAIADFGLARYQAASGKKMTAETGSYRWMAPEVIRHEEYDKRCDVYSFAILAWEMLTYRIPFDPMMPVEAAFAVAREAKRPEIPAEWGNKPIAEMLRACWHQNATKRPPFTAICRALDEEIEMLQTGGGGDLPASPVSL